MLWRRWTTHQHIYIQHPAVFSCTDAQAFQLYAVLVVEDFVQSVTQLRPEFLASSSFKFRSGIGWTFDDKEKGKKKTRSALCL